MSWLTNLRDALQERLTRPPQTGDLAQGAGVIAADAAPAGAPPAAVESLADLETALAWLRWLDSRARTLDAIKSQTLALVEEGHRREQLLPAQETTIPELQQRLETAVLEYARQHQAELFATAQTHRCAAGSVKRSKAPLKIDLDGDAKEVSDYLQRQLRLPEFLQRLAEQSPDLAKLVTLTRVKCEPDKQAAAAAIKDQSLTAADLAIAKMKPAPAGHTFKVEL